MQIKEIPFYLITAYDASTPMFKESQATKVLSKPLDFHWLNWSDEEVEKRMATISDELIEFLEELFEPYNKYSKYKLL